MVFGYDFQELLYYESYLLEVELSDFVGEGDAGFSGATVNSGDESLRVHILNDDDGW